MAIPQCIPYSTKIWLTAALFAPFISVFFVFGGNDIGTIEKIIETLGLLIFFGTVFSIPCWILLMLSTFFIFRRTNDPLLRRQLTQVAAIILGVAISSIVYFIVGFKAMIPYFLLLTFGVWYYACDEPVVLKNLDEGREDILDSGDF